MKRLAIDDYAGPYVEGIDVSHWQGHVDWHAVAAGWPEFAYVRVGDGRDVDRRWRENWTSARSAGVRRGAYQYFRADRGGVAQADLLLHEMAHAGGALDDDLPPALDWEAGADDNLRGGLLDGDHDLTTEQVAEEALRWLERIEVVTGQTPLVYTGQTFHWAISQGRPELAQCFERYPLWIASYTRKPRLPVGRRGEPAPWAEWQCWQYTSKGTCPGVTGSCDVNRWHGDLP